MEFKDLFEAIEFLFVDVLLIPFDLIRLEISNWIIQNAKIYQKNDYIDGVNLVLKTNFDANRIKSLYSNLSALNLIELYELRKNYKKLNYSKDIINIVWIKKNSLALLKKFLLKMRKHSLVNFLELKNHISGKNSPLLC